MKYASVQVAHWAELATDRNMTSSSVLKRRPIYLFYLLLKMYIAFVGSYFLLFFIDFALWFYQNVCALYDYLVTGWPCAMVHWAHYMNGGGPGGWPELLLLTHLHLISPSLDGKCNNKHKITVHCRPKTPMSWAKSVSCVMWVQTWLNLYRSKCQPEWKSVKTKNTSVTESVTRVLESEAKIKNNAKKDC